MDHSSAPQPLPQIDSRIKKILLTRFDNSSSSPNLLIESLENINEYFLTHGNTIQTRKTFKQELIHQNIAYNKLFLEEYQQFYLTILSIQEQVTNISNECSQMSSKILTTNKNMKLFMSKAIELEEKRNLYLQQSQEIESFLNRFQLTSAEIDELHSLSFSNPSSNSTINEQFFSILKRLRFAYNDCKEMVESYQYNAGYELLDLLGHHQDIAYQKLFEWVKMRCETTSSSSFSQFDPDDTILQTALNYLKEVPSYFLQCQELVISSRRSLIVQRFILAVTQGQQSSSSSSTSYYNSSSSSSTSSSTTSRGFEMHSYDPIRFVGDMLAWTHQAIASEEEFLRAIFGSIQILSSPQQSQLSHNSQSKGDIDGSESLFSSSSSLSSSPSTIPELLVRCLSGLGRPLKVRISQAFENLRVDTRRGIETLYSLCDLIQFYSQTYHRILSLPNSVQSAVEECLKECKKLFLSLLNKQSEQLRHNTVSLFTIDTLSTITTKEYCQLLHELLKIYKTSMSLAQMNSLLPSSGSMSLSPSPLPSIGSESSGNSGNSGNSDNGGNVEFDISINHVLECIIHPLLQSCRTCGNTAFVDNNCDMAIFMLNNVTLLKLTLIHSSQDSISCKLVTKQWISLLESEMESWIQLLIIENSNQILQRSEMDQVIDLLEVLPSDMIASEQVGLTSERLGIMLRKFYSSLINSNDILLEQLQDPELRELIRKKSSIKLLEAYKSVYATINNPKNQYQHTIHSLLSHSINEVSVLLNCMEEEK